MGIYEAIKDAANIASKADNIELYRLLIDVQKESLDLLEENRQLKLKIAELEDNKGIDESLIYNNNSYFLKDDTRYIEPYCTRCWDADRKLIRLHIEEWPDRSNLSGECPSCKSRVYDINK